MDKRNTDTGMVLSLEELEKLAMRDQPLPDGVALPEQMLYLALRSVYKAYKSGYLGRDEASAEKNKVMREYKSLELHYRVWLKDAARAQEIAGMAVEMNKSDCPICKRVARVYDGRNNT